MRKLAPLTNMLDPNDKNQTEARSRSKSPGRFQAHNRFHYNCCDDKKPLSIEDVKARSIENVAKRRKARNNQLTSLTTSSPHHQDLLAIEHKRHGALMFNGHSNENSAHSTDSSSSSGMENQIVHYLKSHPEFLESYILSSNVEASTLKRWAGRKSRNQLRNRKNAAENDDSSSGGRHSSGTSQERGTAASTALPVSVSLAPGSSPSLSSSTNALPVLDKNPLLHALLADVDRCDDGGKGEGGEEQGGGGGGHGKGGKTWHDILHDLVMLASEVVGADEANLYVASEETNEIRRYVPGEKGHPPLSINSDTNYVTHCARTKQVSNLETDGNDPLCPESLQDRKDSFNLLVCPILSSSPNAAGNADNNAAILGVAEMTKKAGQGNEDKFSEADEEVVCSYLMWSQFMMQFVEVKSGLQRQKDLGGFLLEVVRSIFMEMISMDTLIVKIMNFAQNLVDADRASLFLVDSKTNQLYARIFDISAHEDGRQNNGGEGVVEKHEEVAREIRFPVGTGIAGYVAETGKTMNVCNAYQDPRFNKCVDEQTGYVTNSILCMPICIRGQVIGIVQMVNKIGGTFTKEDEEAFEVFAIYCGLALHHAKLYDKIRRSEQKYKVALEVLSYHNASSMNEVVEILNEPVPTEDLSVSESPFTFYALNMDDMVKVRKALFMFVDLFGLDRFDYETLVRFIITVKKNYRQVAYHNWTHGFHVANSIYSILKSAPDVFKPLECLSMYIGAICHDLDHRGFNNKFMIDVASPLAAIYSTSTMEHHHFNMTVIILQQENHNIFAKLNPDEYRQVLGNIKHCILATDLALFFPNKARLTSILKEDAFSWELPDHRELVHSLMMTSSDLCSASKLWDAQKQTADIIYAEFHEQGDVEKSLGWKPIPLFDRDHAAEVASMQVGFLGGICTPCYDLLVQVLPSTAPMQEQCIRNLNTWKSKSEEHKLEEAEEEERRRKTEEEEERRKAEQKNGEEGEAEDKTEEEEQKESTISGEESEAILD